MRLFNAVEEAVNQVRDGAAEVVSDAEEAANQVTDTIGDASEQVLSDGGEVFNEVTDTIGDGAVEVVSDGGEVFNEVTDTFGDGAVEVVSGAGEAFNQVTDTIGERTQLMLDLIFWDPVDTLDGIANLVPTTGQEAGEAVNQAAETAKKTVNKFLPVDIGKNLGLALYGILAVAGIIVFVYILSLLKPIFEIGSNVSDK